ncbi:MAG: restriction endonuclease [Chloroflexota bacterium]|nr:restriction endonuclease [Chloroflexota bacterium]
MGPVLRATSGGNERTMKDITADLSREFGLTPEELDTRLPSGGSLFANRVHWATTYLKKAELLESTGRAHVRITQEGRAVLANPPARIDRAFLLRYPAFAAFVRARAPKELGEELGSDILVSPPDASETSTPRERIDAAAKELSLDLADELLAKVKAGSPQFFEGLVIDLLRAMGYGGSQAGATELLGRSGDAGLDGVIRQDRLGLEAVYVQAKRWDNTVGRPTVQAFAGSLDGARARKGVLLTTATFSQEARDYVRGIEKKIVLVDGSELVTLMIEHDIGVSNEATIKRTRGPYGREARPARRAYREGPPAHRLDGRTARATPVGSQGLH